MSELTFELFEIEADETSVLECKFGQYIVGEKGEQGPIGFTGPQGSLTPADTAALAAATASAQNSAGAAKNSATAADASAQQAAGIAAGIGDSTQAAAAAAQAAATQSQGYANNSKGSADASKTSADASAASATASAASNTNASNNASLAKNWATLTTTTVDGTDYSAKWYAQKSATSATQAASSATAASNYATDAGNEAADSAASATAAAGSASAAAGSASAAAGSAASINPANLVPIDGSRAMTAPLQTTGLTLTGTGRRILGDYGNTTQSLRPLFQSNVAGGATSVGAIPNATGAGANFIAYGVADAANAPYLQMSAIVGGAYLNVGATGTGTVPPFTLQQAGVARYTIDAAGNQTFSGTTSAAFNFNTVYFNGPAQSILGFQKAGVLRYGFGWDGANFTCNRYNASGVYTSTPWYVRDSDGAMMLQATLNAGVVNTTGINCTGNSIELGPTAAGPAYIDFHSSGNAIDYDSRIIATAGTAAAGNGTVEFYGGTFNFRPTNNYLNVISAGTYSVLRLQAGSYSPTMRASSGNTSFEWVNSANTAVNLTLTDGGVLTARGSLNAPGLNCWGGLWMQSANSIRLDGGAYSGFLRGDSSGLVGFINQAQNQWTLQIKDTGYVKAMNGFIWGDESNIGGQYNGTGSIGAHTESNTLAINSNNVNLYCGHVGAGGTQIAFYVAGAYVGSVSSSASATSYNTTSDYRLKENIEDLTGGLDRVLQMRPVAFDWKASGASARGFIAHELEPIEPDAVTGVKDAMMQDRGNPEGPEVPAYQQVDLSFCIPDMVAALKELKSQLDAALARVAALESAATP